MLIPIEYCNFILGYYGGEQIQVSPNSQPGLGRTQRCEFWDDNTPLVFRLEKNLDFSINVV